MTYSTHDEIATAALRLCDDVRTTAPAVMYERVAKWCRREPEKAAQLLMCLAVWTDPDASMEELGDRAESVARANAEADARTTPDESVFEEVILLHDITTSSGVLPNGSRQRGRPEQGGMWSVWVTSSQVAEVPESWIHAGGRKRRTLLQARDAREEYQFARECLRYSHSSAFRWLQEQYGTTERQLFRWGIYQPTEVAS